MSMIDRGLIVSTHIYAIGNSPADGLVPVISLAGAFLLEVSG
jgi:hypothetical protein